MTVGQLIEQLQTMPHDLEVFTKKTEFCGNIGEVYSVRIDTYGFFGRDIPCLIISDECEDKEE